MYFAPLSRLQSEIRPPKGGDPAASQLKKGMKKARTETDRENESLLRTLENKSFSMNKKHGPKVVLSSWRRYLLGGPAAGADVVGGGVNDPAVRVTFKPGMIVFVLCVVEGI